MSEVRDCDERSYPASEVRGSGTEELPHAPKPEARGGRQEEPPHARGQRQWLGGPTPRLRVAAQAQEGLEDLSHIEGQEGWQ